jgi:hypothetical protein
MLLPGFFWGWLRVCFIGAVFVFIVSYIIKKLFFGEEVT